jgi:hypothetical protein
MHLSGVLLSVLLILTGVQPIVPAKTLERYADIYARQIGPNNGGHGYAPYNATCPADLTWIRPADSLGKVEKEYLAARDPLVKSAWSSRISSLNLTAPPRTPVVAIALSGGGYRAMISGSGQAFLQNNTKGSAGDILALSTYVGGLSGGSWAVSSFFANDGLSADQLAQNVRVVLIDVFVTKLSNRLSLHRFGIPLPTSSYRQTMLAGSMPILFPKSRPRRTQVSARRLRTTGLSLWATIVGHPGLIPRAHTDQLTRFVASQYSPRNTTRTILPTSRLPTFVPFLPSSMGASRIPSCLRWNGNLESWSLR